MAYDNGQKHPETDAQTRSTPAEVSGHVVRHDPCATRSRNFRNLSRYCDYSERTFARQFRTPFDWPDFHQRVRMTALALHSELISAHDASFISKSGKQTVRSRALLQWLRESCHTRAGDFHTRGGGCHTPVRFRLILPKRHAHYRSENVLLREMVGVFVPPSWAKLVIVGGDAAYGAKANMAMVKAREKADTARR